MNFSLGEREVGDASRKRVRGEEWIADDSDAYEDQRVVPSV